MSGEAQTSYIIPPDTSVQTVVMADNIQRSCSLAVSTDNDTVIRGVMLFAEQVRCALALACLFVATNFLLYCSDTDKTLVAHLTVVLCQRQH